MSGRKSLSHVTPPLVAAALMVLASCSGSSTDSNGVHQCNSTVSSAASTAANNLVVSGTLYSNERLTIGYTLLGHAATADGIAPGNPSPSITFVGLPSGTQSFTFQVTCTGPAPAYAELHSDFAAETITIK